VARISKKAVIMNIYHKVDEVRMENGFLFLCVDGQSISKALIEISPVLVTASDKELSHYEISPSGYGIHWPLLDEDISIDGLLKIHHSPPQRNQLCNSA